MKHWLMALQQDATPDMAECVAQLGQAIDWLPLLQQTPQDAEWHGEGNVHIHTDWVLKALYQLLETDAQHIQGWRRQALILGALLHDIGKPQQTRTMMIQEKERIASPQHESIGRSYLAFRLMALPLSFQVIWTVLGLVGEHHMPKLLVLKNKSEAEYLSLSRRADMELLYWLEVADMRGRVCPDLDMQLMYLAEFKLFAQEYQSWQQPYCAAEIIPMLSQEPTQAQHYIYAYALYQRTQGDIVMAEEALAKTYRHKMQHAQLWVMCGPSGIGKSCWIQRHCTDAVLISLDEIRAELDGCRRSQKNNGRVLQLAKQRLKACLSAGKCVVWDATNLRRDFRQQVCDLGRDYHALVTLVVFLAPCQTIIKGNANREYAVPDDVLQQQLARYQFPLLDEAHRYRVIGPDGATLWQAPQGGWLPESA